MIKDKEQVFLHSLICFSSLEKWESFAIFKSQAVYRVTELGEFLKYFGFEFFITYVAYREFF